MQKVTENSQGKLNIIFSSLYCNNFDGSVQNWLTPVGILHSFARSHQYAALTIKELTLFSFVFMKERMTLRVYCIAYLRVCTSFLSILYVSSGEILDNNIIYRWIIFLTNQTSRKPLFIMATLYSKTLEKWPQNCDYNWTLQTCEF